MMFELDLYDHIQRIREIVERAPDEFVDSAAWLKACSAMDVIEDTEAAISAYRATSDHPENVDRLYLHLYGLLQALYLQQDAIGVIHQALGIKYNRCEELCEIREIRNDACGHPSNRRGKESGFFIVKLSLERARFELAEFGADPRPLAHD